jgi:hypothetical protein
MDWAICFKSSSDMLAPCLGGKLEDGEWKIVNGD